MTPHCWKEGKIDGESAYCMLLLGHKGPHDFVLSSEIVVRFPEEGKEIGK